MPRKNYWSLDGLFGVPVRATIRILQFVLAVVTIALVATDLSSATNRATYIYALFAAVVSILIDVWHCLATVQHAAWLILDFLMAVLWAALAGAIGSPSGDDPQTSGSRRQRLYATIGIGVVCVALWIASCILGCAWCWTARKSVKKESLELAEATEV